MNIPESRDFVVKYRPICCDRQVDTLGYNTLFVEDVIKELQLIIGHCTKKRLES